MYFLIKNRRFLLMTIILALVLACPLTFAAAGTITESESNNSRSSADITYDDYDNKGKLSSSSDSDWWKVTFSSGGMANFWLDTGSSSLDYDLYLYDSNGTLLDWSYDRGTQRYEIIKYDVIAGTTYYIEICSLAGDYSTSKQYWFRAKYYPAPSAKIFTFQYTNSTESYDSTATATQSLSTLWDMGYSAGNYLNNAASSGLSSLRNSDIVVIHHHAQQGSILFRNGSGTTSYLSANSSTNPSLSSLSSSALSDLELVIYMGCHSGTPLNNASNNLIDVSLSKGALCAIGWKSYTFTGVGDDWITSFFQHCEKGKKISEALAAADASVKDRYSNVIYSETNKSHYYYITQRYVGASDLTQVIG